jgi:hypothetical protein
VIPPGSFTLATAALMKYLKIFIPQYSLPQKLIQLANYFTSCRQGNKNYANFTGTKQHTKVQ